MQYGELIDFLQNLGKDPSRLIFEDELTGLQNRRFLLSYFEHKVLWDRDDNFPLSLMVMDVDLFKTINDTFGHDAGDEALIFVAGLIREVAGEKGYPVRYGGDEFMLLLPQTELDDAVLHAYRIHQLTKERPLVLKNGSRINISLSIGVASARTDARSGNDLIRKADTALYTSKKLGRNRVTAAAESDLQKTFKKTALHRLDGAEITGRRAELAAIENALKAFASGESKFLVFEGAAGMGKSTLIDSVRRSLTSNAGLHVVRVSGRQQEGYRPYYLVGETLIQLMNRRTDKGIAPLEGLELEELNYLGHVLPNFEKRVDAPEESEQKRREGIFLTLVRFLEKLLGGQPSVLLVDDLHLADEGSLLLLALAVSRGTSPLFVCGTLLEAVGVRTEEETPPWERFYASRSEQLSIDKHKMRPLDAQDIAAHLSEVFPGIDLPSGLEKELAQITQGNPLFLGEIVRKLVLDAKLTLSGQRWTVEPLEEGYLPRSLDEIVTEKLAALDAEGRKLLEQVSTMGESVPLSVVTGASDVSESQVLDFLDRAETLGLLRSDFDINDETMRFLSRRVSELVYGSLDDRRRKQLHEQVGTYQEGLYDRRLGLSASILAYHFKRSANQEKARRYDQIRIDLSQRTFNREEAEQYTGEPLVDEDEEPGDDRLAPEALAALPNFFRNVLTTVRSVQLYPPESKPIQKAHLASLAAVEAVLEHVDHFELSRTQGVLLANGHKIDVADFRLLANSYIELLDRSELEGIAFQRGIDGAELSCLLNHLGGLRSEEVDGGYWKRFAAENGLHHVGLKQMRYSEVRRPKVRAGAETTTAEETELDPKELPLLPRILRALMGAVKNVRLYPVKSGAVTTSIRQLREALSELFKGRRAITFAGSNDVLIVNGARISTTGYESLATGFLSFMASSELTSLTFLEQVTDEEIETFVAVLKELPGDVTPSFWQELAAERTIHGMAFNDRRYATSVVQSVIASVEAEEEPGPGGPEEGDFGELSQEPTEVLVDALPTVGKDLLVKGERELARKVFRRVFSDYASQDVAVRGKIVRSCRALLESLIRALQHQFASLAAEYLLRALREEQDDHLVGELAHMLYQMTSSVLQFADYSLASRIFLELRDRQRELMKAPIMTSRGLAVLNRKMDSSTSALLMQELQSKEPERQERAAQVLESLGKPAIPLLIEVIKQEKDFRTRHMAAGLLARMGPEAAERIKREVVLEVTSEQRFRILEVIDVVTRDLKIELAFCLSDINPKVRRAAFRLSERLNDKQVLEILVDFAHHQDIGVAKGAIRSLANLRSAHAVGALVSNLQVTKDPERAIACAQALAQLGDPVAVPVLEKVLSARKYPLFGAKRWDDQVRATAAFALATIGGDLARAALSKVKDDPDPRIRQIAVSGIHLGVRTAPVDVDEADSRQDEDEDEGVA